MIQIDALPAFNDNYIWLLQDATTVAARWSTRRCQAGGSLAGRPSDWRLSDILVTHHHHDHVGGVAALKELTGARVLGPANEKIPARDLALEDGERSRCSAWSSRSSTCPAIPSAISPTTTRRRRRCCSAATPCSPPAAAVSSKAPRRRCTIPWRDWPRCRPTPGSTAPTSTSLSNLRFALAVEPDNAALRERFEEATRLRERDRITLPSEISLELSTNPFLRVSEKFC